MEIDGYGGDGAEWLSLSYSLPDGITDLVSVNARKKEIKSCIRSLIVKMLYL